MIGSTGAWAVVVIVVVPLLVIVAAEYDERLRQRRSRFRGAVATLRNWALPFFAIWALLVPVLDVAPDSLAVRAASTGLVLSIATAAYGVVARIVRDIRYRPVGDGRRSVPQLLLAVPRIAIVLVASWLLVDTVWGIDLSAALTALGVTSLVVSFALQDTLSGLASGFLLLSDQPFQPGDWIRSGDTEGVVEDINWRTSRLRDRNGDMIIVPNSQLAGATVVNYSSPDRLHRVVVTVQVAFHNSPTAATQMLLDAAVSTRGVLSDPAPTVMVVQVDDPLMTYEIHLWVDDYATVPRVASECRSLVWYQSHRHGVGLPSPAQDLYVYDGNAATAASKTTVADVRDHLARSTLLAGLDPADVERLAAGADLGRFRSGETIVAASRSTGALVVIAEGSAELRLRSATGDRMLSPLGDGDVVGLLDRADLPRGDDVVAVATTDCVVLEIAADVSGEVVSRSAELSAALNRTATVRRRRLTDVLRTADVSSEDPR